MNRWTIEDFNKGVSIAINGNGEVVNVSEVTDRLLLCQGIRFSYRKRDGYVTFVNNDGRLLSGYETVLDLFRIE